MNTTTYEQLTPAQAQAILESLPERIRTAFTTRAAEIDYPVEAVIEMALAGYIELIEARLKRAKEHHSENHSKQEGE